MNTQKKNPASISGSTFQITIAKLIPIIKRQPSDLQLKVLWILFEALSAEIDQLKAYHNADLMAFANKASLLENAAIDNSDLDARLTAEITNLLEISS